MSWWKETAQAVSEAKRSNPQMSADRLAEEARRIYNQRKTSTPATTSGPQKYSYNYRTANEAREGRAASIVGGVAHDSFRLQPVGLPPQVMAPIVSFTDQYYIKMDQEEARGLFRTLPSWQQQAWAKAAQVLGGGPRTAESTYGNYLEMSGYLSAKGINKDPLDLLMEDVQSGYMPPSLFDERAGVDSGGSGGGYYGGGGGGGGGATSQRIDLTSYTGAQALLTQFMQSSMGRSPKAKEVGEFYKLLKQYQTNNPTVVSASGNTVTQSGGVDAGVVAQEFVETLPDYTEGQADKYYRVFMSALLGGA